MPIRVVFVCLPDQGHLQIPISLGKSLLFRDPKSEIYFVVDEPNKHKITEKCSAFKTLTFNAPSMKDFESPTASEEKFRIWTMENEERFKTNAGFFGKMIFMWKARATIIQELISRVEPDLVIVENLFNLPFVECLKYKWAFVVSTNPLKVANQIDYPPMGSGVTVTSEYYANVMREQGAPFREELDKFYREHGLERKPTLCHVQPSPWLNVCIYPRPLNYFDVEKGEAVEGRWIQLSSTILKDEVNQFVERQGWSNESAPGTAKLLTKEFLERPAGSKLILFSMGTLVSQNRQVFDKLLPALAGCPQHRFIVSKGSCGDDWELPANCIGANNLNQLELLRSGQLDLFITHGGNNSFTEAFYFNVPIVVIPCMADQHDNAERLEHFGLGRRILLQNVTSAELCKAIDYVTSDEVRSKIAKVSEAVRKNDAMDRLCDAVIEICSKP